MTTSRAAQRQGTDPAGTSPFCLEGLAPVEFQVDYKKPDQCSGMHALKLLGMGFAELGNQGFLFETCHFGHRAVLVEYDVPLLGVAFRSSRFIISIQVLTMEALIFSRSLHRAGLRPS